MNSHRKGSRWRRAVELWLRDQGFTTTFRALGVAGDDITAVRGGLRLSVECKNQQRFDLAGWIAQAEGNCPEGAVPVVVAHRPRRSDPADCYVILTGRAFARLVSRLVSPEPPTDVPTHTPRPEPTHAPCVYPGSSPQQGAAPAASGNSRQGPDRTT